MKNKKCEKIFQSKLDFIENLDLWSCQKLLCTIIEQDYYNNTKAQTYLKNFWIMMGIEKEDK